MHLDPVGLRRGALAHTVLPSIVTQLNYYYPPPEVFHSGSGHKARADALEQGSFDPNPDDKKNSEDNEEEVEEKEEGEESASESEAGTEYDSDGHPYDWIDGTKVLRELKPEA
jgi:hypothetical protein